MGPSAALRVASLAALLFTAVAAQVALALPDPVDVIATVNVAITPTTLPAATSGQLAVKTDATGVRTTSAGTSRQGSSGMMIKASESDVTRLRLALEGIWQTATFAPRVEIAARYDGGDAETGYGVDLGAGVRWRNPGAGV